MRKRTTFLAGVAATLAIGALWHGPLGAGGRMGARVEAEARQMLVDWEMTAVSARVENAPLARQIVLDGPADDFQRSELKRLVKLLPSVSGARWANEPRRASVPLIIEAELAALAGFLIGLLIAYLGELRRRSRQWDRF